MELTEEDWNVFKWAVEYGAEVSDRSVAMPEPAFLKGVLAMATREIDIQEGSLELSCLTIEERKSTEAWIESLKTFCAHMNDYITEIEEEIKMRSEKIKGYIVTSKGKINVEVNGEEVTISEEDRNKLTTLYSFASIYHKNGWIFIELDDPCYGNPEYQLFIDLP